MKASQSGQAILEMHFYYTLNKIMTNMIMA